MIKPLILLSSILILNSCSKKEEDIVFINQQFKNELDKFIEENKNNYETRNILHLDISDEEDIFVDVKDKSDQYLYLTFYYCSPENCEDFYKSFKYKGKDIFLFDKSDKIKFIDLITINNESNSCGESIPKSHIDVQPRKRYYFDENKKLIEIKDDGTLRKVE